MVEAVGLAVGSVVAATVAYGVLVAPRRPQLTRHEVELPGLPPALDGLRVVQLSDVHLGPFFGGGDVRRAVRRANACEPDLAVLTGDFVNFRSMRYLKAGVSEVGALKARLGVFACLGNHDHWEGVEEVRSALEGAGVKVLVNESVRLDGSLWLGAVDDVLSAHADLDAVVNGVPDDAAVVLLSHNPTVLHEVAAHPWLILSGHSHGGQLGLPFVSARVTMRLPGIAWLARSYESLGVRVHGGSYDAVCTHRFPAGWYREGVARVYVNRGLGLNQTWPIRLNCPPEISCFTLRATQESGAA